ncbi:MAG TPA: 50S ribosomal protein L19 [Actinobacteria bacterium]|jgi:large subunit ribosomal protein L19|nr:50S ribosomal protein L19 [Actinomycetota bacterium]
MNGLEKIESKYYRNDIPDFKPGDKVKVNIKIKEENKERVQTFQGIVINRQSSGLNETFTVRKVSFNVGVERTFLINSPMIHSIEKVSTGIVRRAKLYYLRDKIGKKSRVKTVEQ